MTDPSDRASPAPESTQERRGDGLLLLLATVLYAPFAWAGIGSDADAHMVIDQTARSLLRDHRYVPSRFPGYFVQEVGETALYAVGGSVLANLGTVAMAVAGLWFLLRVLRRLSVPNPRLLTAVMMVHPLYWTNAATTIDYLWAVTLTLAGYDAWLRRRPVVAGLLFGLAVGARLSSVFVALVLFGFALWRGPTEARRRALQMAGVGGAVGALLYVPSFVAAGNSFGFFQYAIGRWGVAAYVARFVYKNLYFWGLPAFLWVLALAFVAVRRTWGDRRRDPDVLVPLVLIVAFEALFLKVPLEPGYLLPMLPFVLLVLGRTIRRRALWALFAAVLFGDFVSLNVARPDHPHQATSATVGLWVEPGELLRNTVTRCRLFAELRRAAPETFHAPEDRALCRLAPPDDTPPR